MKKLMFLALALLFTTYSTASNATQYVTNFFTGATASSTLLDQQTKNPLILDKYQKGDTKNIAAHYSHYSHSSHSSHYSHSSHSSHYSHYSARW
ncbi:MAG TPA: hypothetical protein H9850_08920 [Candidatus Anaerobiospirillum pullistercoris]|uniref:Uncharacterized protein n=1 Tax=Candidatus Anaerobiospirillum pullistercoris TaxID=2838452 RepID=A0A9D1WEN5_9GAMM|nr:hypothetical protein [Candidatus Anaerobiospirillum pullistercoris]